MTLGQRINRIISEKGLKINAIEKELGFGNGTIRRWDINSPSCEKVEKIANFLNVSIEYLITGQNQITLTPEEQEILEAYRNADPMMKAGARKLLDLPDLPQGKSFDCEIGKEAI